MNSEKFLLRRQMLSVSIEGENFDSLWRNVESLPEFDRAGTLLLYSSLPDEVPTGEFIRRWFPVRRIALPVVSGESLELRLYDPGRMRPGYRGIMEPSENAPEISPNEIDLAVVPGVAFDVQCNRMGRGKGFYDRFIPLLECPVVGVSPDVRIADFLPVDLWDVPLSAVVTPTHIYCRRYRSNC